VKYFRPEHHFIRFGAKPFLIVTEQGGAGTGLSSATELWIDLTAPEFEPLLYFTSRGDYRPLPDGISSTVHGIVTSMSVEPVERITVAMSITFWRAGPGEDRLELGGRRDTAVFSRASGGDFELLPKESTATASQIEDFYNDIDSAYSPEEFVTFNFKGLQSLAGRNADARAWLAKYLSSCPNTAGVRQLKALLARR
jgi:hypothetical protein